MLSFYVMCPSCHHQLHIGDGDILQHMTSCHSAEPFSDLLSTMTSKLPEVSTSVGLLIREGGGMQNMINSICQHSLDAIATVGGQRLRINIMFYLLAASAVIQMIQFYTYAVGAFRSQYESLVQQLANMKKEPTDEGNLQILDEDDSQPDEKEAVTSEIPLDDHTQMETGEAVAALEHCPPTLPSRKVKRETVLKTGYRHQAPEHHDRQHRKRIAQYFKCAVCAEEFEQTRAFREHCITEHNLNKMFSCSDCPKSFSRHSELLLHTRTHSGERPFTCSTCGKGFTSKGPMDEHLRIHTGEMPYRCSTCGKEFRQSGALWRHRRTHSSDRPFVCAECGRAFALRTTLQQHARTHADARPHICGHCGKSFLRKESMQVHERIHTGEKPYLCATCGKSFCSRADMFTHARTHTGERPYVCNVCNKTYTCSSSLQRHVRVHTGARPFPCAACHKTFSRSSHLKRHMRTHAPSKEKPTVTAIQLPVITESVIVHVDSALLIRTNS